MLKRHRHQRSIGNVQTLDSQLSTLIQLEASGIYVVGTLFEECSTNVRSSVSTVHSNVKCCLHLNFGVPFMERFALHTCD